MKKKIISIPLCFLMLLMLLMTAASCGRDPKTTEEETKKEKTTASADVVTTAAESESAVPRPELEIRDADAYFSEHGTVLDVANLQDEDAMLTEAGAYELLNERGFSDYRITAGNDSEGNMTEPAEISPNSKNRHPIYETYYVSAQNILWVITVTGHTVTANPLSFNLESEKEVMIIVTETEYVTSFDNASRRFFRTVPAESVLALKKVERIDKAALDQMTWEELSK